MQCKKTHNLPGNGSDRVFEPKVSANTIEIENNPTYMRNVLVKLAHAV